MGRARAVPFRCRIGVLSGEQDAALFGEGTHWEGFICRHEQIGKLSAPFDKRTSPLGRKLGNTSPGSMPVSQIPWVLVQRPGDSMSALFRARKPG